jgi:branched-chain amino acid transport system permease protein
MNFVNMAHGIFYIIGNHAAVTSCRGTQSFVATLFLIPLIKGVIGTFCEVALFKHFHKRPPFHQVLWTVGTILFADERGVQNLVEMRVV